MAYFSSYAKSLKSATLTKTVARQLKKSASGFNMAEGKAWRDCLGQQEATDIDKCLFSDYQFSIDQLMEVAGLCVAQVSKGMCPV